MIKRIKKFLKGKNKIKKERRSFSTTQKISLWYSQDGLCKVCGEPLDMRTVRYDHIKRYSQGGKTQLDNGQAVCSNCHSRKTFEENISLIEPTLND